MGSSWYPNWVSLPSDVRAEILRHVGAKEIQNSAQWVCVTWHKICKEPYTWRSLDMYNFLNTPSSNVTEIMCRDVVDRSSGCLVDVTLRCPCSVQLLRYVALRAPQLRSLRLSFCNMLCNIYLCEVAKKLPNLEELHIFSTTVSKEVIESFGERCTQIKSLTYNDAVGDGDAVALAIAQTMPGLRHLRLCRNKMTNDGLQAILNHCPHLETLDLRQCFNVNLEGAFGRTCAEQIKNLKLPNDLIDIFQFDRILNNERWYDSSDDEISTSSSSSSSSSSSLLYKENSRDEHNQVFMNFCDKEIIRLLRC